MRAGGCVVLALALAGCAAQTDREAETGAQTMGEGSGFETGFVPSLFAREGRPCGDIVGISNAGAAAAGIVQLGQDRSLVAATPEMIACVEANGLEVEFTS